MLSALKDVNTLSQLDERPNGLRRIFLRIRRDRIDSVEPYSADVAQALRAAAAVDAVSNEVGIELRVTNSSEYERWSRLMRAEIADLIGVLPDFEEAKVRVGGVKQPVNLLRANVQRGVEVSIVGSKRVGANEAAEALFEAYDQERNSISEAVEARRRS